MSKSTKVKVFLRQNIWSLGVVFFIPIIIMGIVYYHIGIYPGSERSVLACDSFAQYSNFHASFNNVLHGKQDMFYTWAGSLGLNYWALSAYYLNGIFTFLVGFFDNSQIPTALYFLTILKIGISGVAFWFFAYETYSKIDQRLIVGMSIAYALMSYTVGYSEVIMWLDVMSYLPLVILGINRVIEKKKPVLLFISYLLLFLSSFYLGFMVGVFSFLYYLTRVLLDWKSKRKSIPMYLLTSFLAGGASMVTILPTLLDLRSNGESLTPIDHLFTVDMGPWDLVAKSMVGVYDTSKYQSMPFIYVGILPLLFFVFYFLSKKIAWREKLANGFLVILLMASFYIYPLNLFWHGLHSPNMFLFRFSFLLSFMVIMIAGYGIEAFGKEELNTWVNGTLGTALLFFLFLFLSNKKRYGLITLTSVIATFVCLFAYLLMVSGLVKRPNLGKWICSLILLLMIGESLVNTQAMIKGIEFDWNYPSTSLYTEGHEDIQALTEQANERNKTFFRMENLEAISNNDSFNFGYHGVTLFSSIRNRRSSQYINTLGFRSTGTNLQVSYLNNTLYGDAFIGMKYNLSKQNPQKFGYQKIGQKGEFALYENQMALPLGVLTDEEIYQHTHTQNQLSLVNHLSKLDERPFSYLNPSLIDSQNTLIKKDEVHGTIELQEKELDKPKQVSWLVTIPAKKQAYLSLVPTDFALASSMEVYMTINGKTQKGSLEGDGQYYNIGYFEEPTSVQIDTMFTKATEGQFKVELFGPQVVLLDTESYKKTIQAIQKKGVDFQTNGHEATAQVSVTDDQVLLTTIPFDKGWEAWIDGKKIKVQSVESAFIALNIPKGKHTIRLRFLPSGFKLGFGLLISCNLLFLLYLVFLKRYEEKGRMC